MSNHNGQTSSQSDKNSDETQLSFLRQQNIRLITDIKQFGITRYRNTDDFNSTLNTATQKRLL